MKILWCFPFLMGACSTDDENPADECSEYAGSIFVSSDEDVGTISSTLFWPEDLPEGLSIEMGVADDFSYLGAMPDSWFIDTCGTQMNFFLYDVPAGDHLVVARVQAADQPTDDTADTVYVAEGETPVSSNNDDVTGVEIHLE